MGRQGSEKTAVEIFGAVYHVRGSENGEYLRELAGLVDRKMREVAREVTTVDTARIAILAALNLSDELFQCRRDQEGDRARLKEKASALTAELDSALRTLEPSLLPR
jgi:cell division protein ZapA